MDLLRTSGYGDGHGDGYGYGYVYGYGTGYGTGYGDGIGHPCYEPEDDHMLACAVRGIIYEG